MVFGFIMESENRILDCSQEGVIGMMRCPGQDTRNLRAEIHPCPKCGYGVEIFSDESKVKCYQCGEIVYREKTPSCVEWCSAARQCLGEERWRQLKGEIDNGGG